MAKAILTYLNKVLGMVIGALGLTGCVAAKYGVPEAVAMYGCPAASFAAEGKVVNEQAQPVEGVKVTAGDRRYMSEESMGKALTDERGEYHITVDAMFPTDSIWLYADDTTGVYAGDSVRVKVEYEGNGDGMWDMGSGKAEADFTLVKKIRGVCTNTKHQPLNTKH
ncbi:MAG: radical SAM-associated putative lipoprotein [Paludibacteraceae bacterium]